MTIAIDIRCLRTKSSSARPLDASVFEMRKYLFISFGNTDQRTFTHAITTNIIVHYVFPSSNTVYFIIYIYMQMDSLNCSLCVGESLNAMSNGTWSIQIQFRKMIIVNVFFSRSWNFVQFTR